MDLYRHIKDLHPDAREYQCWDCDASFQTDHDRINHMNLVHKEKIFACKSCHYTAVVKSRMRAHVHVHLLKKFDCLTCDAKLSSHAALRKHTLLHLAKDEHQCEQCDK